MFGSSKFSFPSSGFNTTTTAASSTVKTGGLFGSSIFSTPAASVPSTTSSFGSLGFSNLSGTNTFGTTSPFKTSTTATFGIATPNPGTTIKFEPVTSTDTVKKGSVNQKQNIKFMAISAMTQYISKSFEELRHEDYLANRKSGNIGSSLFKPAIGGSVFSATTSSSGSTWFNKQFGILTTSAASSTNTFGTTAKPLFASGAFAFNTPATTPVTTSSIFSFGSTVTTQSNIFGKPATPIGTGLFSTPATTTSSFNLFGSTTPTTTSSTGLFSTFGTPTTSNSITGGLFSSSKPFGATTSTFGTGGLFGSSITTTTPAATASAFTFGATAKPATTGLFGQTTTPAFSFGQTQLQSTSQSQAAPVAASIFGNQTLSTGLTFSVNQPAASSLLLLASKDKDPEIVKRSAQMLMRAQCFSYSDDPIFHDYIPTSNSSTDKLLKTVINKSLTDATIPESCSHRVRSILPKSMNCSGLYESLDREYKPGSLDRRGGRSIDLKRLVLPNRSSIKLELSDAKPADSKHSSITESTLGDYLSGNSRSICSPIDTSFDTSRLLPESQFSCCKLTRNGYKTYPLQQTLIIDPSSGTCLVSNFAIYREGYGSISWPGFTDVADMDIDKIVFIRRKEVIVYPDDDDKPPVNEGLNKPAEITLHSVYPLDKFTRQQVKDPNLLEEMNYAQYLEEATVKMGARFIDYIASTGSWTFKVDHFTRYGLDTADISNEKLHPSTIHNSLSRWQNKVLKPTTKDLLGSTSDFVPDAYSTLLNGCAIDHVEDVSRPVKELTRRMSSMNSDFSKEDESLEDIDQSVDFGTLNEYHFVPFWIPWESSLFYTDRNLVYDRAFYTSRSFRFNIVEPRRVYYPLDSQSLVVLQRKEFVSFCCETSINHLLTVQFNFRKLNVGLSYPQTSIKATPNYLKCLQSITKESPAKSTFGECLTDSVLLLNILFTDDVNDKERKENLILWLKNSSQTIDNSKNDLYAGILKSLCSLDRKSAVQSALASKHYRLAQLMSISPGNQIVQNILKNQVIHWCDREVDQYIDKDLLKIYLLLSGELFIEMSDSNTLSLLESNDWRQNLLIILRYCCLSDAPCTNGIILLDNLMKSQLLPFSDDYLWNILKFYVDPATSDLGELLQPRDHFHNDDFSLSWHLLQAVHSLSIKSINLHLFDRVCQEFSRQLETTGMWDWACFVSSHIQSEEKRFNVCENMLTRNVCVEHDLNTVESWIVKELRWDRRCIHKAKAIKAQYLKSWFLCCDHRLQADNATGALSLIFHYILTEAFEKDDRSELVQLLDLISNYVARHGAVSGWIESARCLHLYFCTQSKFAIEHNWTTSDDKLIEFAEAVTRNFEEISRKMVNLENEGKIKFSILRTIGEGIISSMHLLCKWIAEGHFLNNEIQLTRSLNILSASKSISSNIDYTNNGNIELKLL